ncbi:MAG: polysaccharide deacetylase family protein [Bryobacteraceae bacterium]
MTAAPSAILMYHSLDQNGSSISTPPDRFRRQMQRLAGSGSRVVPLEEMDGAPGAVALTFDDGFRNFAEHAAPVLSEFGFPATVFLVTGHCGRHNDWPSQPRGIPRLELMSWSEVRDLAAAGIRFGAHSVDHPRLTSLPRTEIERQLAGSRSAIEDRVGQPVEAFAYPYGAVDGAVREIAGRHFRLACGIELRFLDARPDRLNLPRIDAHYLRESRALPGPSYLAFRRGLRGLRMALDR